MDEQQNANSTDSTDKSSTHASDHTLPECPYHHDCANCPLNKGKENDQKAGC